MQLYIINATPQRYDVSDDENARRHAGYATNVSDVLSRWGIDGFTIQEVQGYWQGKPERSYIITVALDKQIPVDTGEGSLNSDTIIKAVAGELRDMYNQDAVMVTYPDSSVKFIERP